MTRLVELHQPVDVAVVDGPAERAAREARRDALGARPLLRSGFGRADEDLVAARRARDAGGVVRSLEIDAADDARHAHLTAEAETAIRLEAVDRFVGAGSAALDERD